MNRLGKVTAIVCATAGLLAWVAPSHAFNMIQASSSGRTTSGAIVSCDDPNGFVRWTSPNPPTFRTNMSITVPGFFDAVQGGIDAWTAVTGASHVLSHVPSGLINGLPVQNADGINSITFHNDGSSPCVGNCLAITALSLIQDLPNYVITEADVVFNVNHTWTTNGGDFDIRAVATHELGHALGIHHTTVSGATMTANYVNNAGWRSLENDDRDALRCSEDWYVSPAYQGVHESSTCREIKGWARNNKRPNGFSWHRVHNNSLSWVNVRSDVCRPDVGCHGWSMVPPSNYKTGNTITVTAKFPNGTVMAGSPQTVICQVGIFKNQTPASFIDTGGIPWSVGNVFYSQIPGYVTHLRYYKAAEESGVHTLKLWTEGGQFLSSVDVNFGNPGAAGWKTGKLSGIGVAIQANTNYVVSVTTSTKQSKTDCGFSSPITNGPIVGHGGRWVQGNGVFPTTTSCSNFWTDVYFDQ